MQQPATVVFGPVLHELSTTSPRTIKVRLSGRYATLSGLAETLLHRFFPLPDAPTAAHASENDGCSL